MPPVGRSVPEDFEALDMQGMESQCFQHLWMYCKDARFHPIRQGSEAALKYYPEYPALHFGHALQEPFEPSLAIRRGGVEFQALSDGIANHLLTRMRHL